MSLTPHQIKLLKQSWSIFRSIDPNLVADVFYSKLFLENASLRKLFAKNMDGQYKKLIDMLSLVIVRLDKLDEITGEITALAKRHEGYGVKTIHYEMVGAALLWTLEQGLGIDWTAEIEAAWKDCYQLLSNTMIQATEI